MLDIMRKSASKWWLKALLLTVALSFIVGFGILSSVDVDDPNRYAAKVGNTIITHTEFQKALENQILALKEKFGDALTDEDIKTLNIENSVLNEEINRVLTIEEARRLNVPIADEEIRDMIKTIPYFNKDGQFNFEQYRNVLKNNRLTEAGFEALIRNDIMIQKLNLIVKDSAKVMDEDIVMLAKLNGMTAEEYDALLPEEKETIAMSALMQKRIKVYDNFINELRAKTEIVINEEYKK
jgi:peptidyl-prolyl cis-trans isomerase D